MPSLLDIGPKLKKMTINDVEVEVRGLSGTAFLHLLDGYPELRKLMGGGNRDIEPEELMKQVPGAVAGAIAMGCGYSATINPLDFNTAVEKINSLSLGDQVELLTTIWDMTFPKGIKSFTAALEKLAGEVVGVPTREVAMKSLGQ